MNSLALLSGFSLQTKLLLIVLVFTIGFAFGYKVSSALNSSNQAHSINQQIKTSDTIAKDTKQEVKQLQEKLVETKVVYRTIKERIHDENDTRICFADSTALGLWNDAIAGENTHRPVVTGEAATINHIVATVEEVLSNATENFETCNTNSIKHNALIDRVESLDGKMCICSQ